MPATLQIDKNLQVARSTAFPGLDIIVHRVDCIAEIRPKPIVLQKVVNKVIQNPMPECCERADADNPPVILPAVDRPLETRE